MDGGRDLKGFWYHFSQGFGEAINWTFKGVSFGLGLYVALLVVEMLV